MEDNEDNMRGIKNMEDQGGNLGMIGEKHGISEKPGENQDHNGENMEDNGKTMRDLGDQRRQ